MTAGRPAGGRPRRAGRGYTLVELFVTVAVLMMSLGLVVNVANRLRSDSLERLARARMQRLTADVDRYAADHGGRLPDVTPLVDPSVSDPREADLQAAAARNRDDVRRALRGPGDGGRAADDALSDPWGTPIALMPRQSPIIGMAPGDRFFFVSGGPDRQFLTRADNLYSYDTADAAAATPAVAGQRSPGPGGHRE